MMLTNNTNQAITITFGGGGELPLPPRILTTVPAGKEKGVETFLKTRLGQALVDEKSILTSRKKIDPDNPLSTATDPKAPESLTKDPEKNGKTATLTKLEKVNE